MTSVQLEAKFRPTNLGKIMNEPPIMEVIGDRVRNRPARAKNAHLDDDDRMLILFGLSRSWSARKIAEALPASIGTVKNFKARIFDDPGSLFDLPILVQSGPKSHDCQFCGGRRDSRVEGVRHVLAHVFPQEVARDMPLQVVEKPL